MKQNTFLYRPSTLKLLIIATAVTSLYWIVGNTINVYNPAMLGAIFEMLWVPILLLSLVIPILSFLILIKKGTSKIIPILSILIVVATIVFLTISK